MGAVSKWELAGVPAALVFGALHKLGAFAAIGVGPEMLPDLMLVAYVIVALGRGMLDRARRDRDRRDGPA